MLMRELRDRNVEIAADQRAEHQEKSRLRAYAKPHVRVAQRAQLDEQQQYEEKNHQPREVSRREGQIMHFALVHLRCAVWLAEPQ